jgi:hypothetical protein
MEKIKVLEIGAEGGLLSIYRTTIDNKDFYFSDENSGIDDFRVSNNEKRRHSYSFAEEFIIISSRYPNILSLHPLFVHEDYKNFIILMLKDYQLEKEFFVDYQSWSRVLDANIEEFKIENPTYTMLEYQNLKEKYGNISSWAIWDENDHKDTLIIGENIGLLNSRYVGIGLNISNPVAEWSNFRGTHCRKLQQTFNKGRLRGFYLTDILKNIVESNSSIIEQKIKSKEIEIEKHIEFFIQEMKDVKITEETKFLIFGNLAYELFNKYLKAIYPHNQVIKLKHYSARGTDKEWVKSTLDKIGILEEYIESGIFEEKYFEEMENTKPKTYRDNLIVAVNNLIEFENNLFNDLLNVAMSNEYKEIDDTFEIGDEFNFSLEHFENSNDQNVIKLVNLIKEIRQSVETIMNINNIKENDR